MDDDWGRPSEEPAEHELAGRGRRLVAVLLNGALFMGLPYVLTASFAPHAFENAAPVRDEQTGLLVDPNASASLLAGGIFLGCWLIFGIISCILISKSGQSMGKAAVGIRIVRVEGTRAGFWRIAGLRWFVSAVSSALIGLIGVIDILFIFRKDRRCLHDLIAGTMVVMDRRTPEEAAGAPHWARPAVQRTTPAVTNVLAPSRTAAEAPSQVPFGRPDPPPAW
jgi:uncharacterized RDD family membrane protein YckC